MTILNVIIPAYNEEQNIEAAIRAVESISTSLINKELRLIVVNDASTDKTREIVEKLFKEFSNISLINRTGERGLGHAIKSGFQEIKEGYAVIVMADLADDVKDIPKMAELIDQGNDFICGSRYMKGGYASHHIRVKGGLSKLMGFCFKIFTGIPTWDSTNAFKMYRSEIIKKIGTLKSGNYTTGLEILIKVYVNQYKVVEIPTVWQDRNHGVSHFKILKVAPEYIYWFLYGIFRIWMTRIIRIF